MSVELYVNKAKAGIAKKIQENTEFIKNNPYPLAELNKAIESAGANSALAKRYDANGIKKTIPEIIIAAKDEASLYPGLWNSLAAGAKSLTAISQNKELAVKDPMGDLTNTFNKFIFELNKAKSLGSPIKLDKIFSDKTTSDDFEEYLNSFSLNLTSYGAEDLVKPAFIELYKAKIQGDQASQATSINTTGANKPESPSKTSPINSTQTASKEKVSVTSSEGGVTSKPGEIVEETKVPVNETKPAINININQAAQVIPPTTEKSTSTLNTPSEATSSPKGIPTPIGSVTVPPAVSTISTINSSEKILVPEKSASAPPQVTPVQNIQQPAQLVTPEKSVSTTILNTPLSSTTSSMSVENTSNISNSAPNVKSENKKILDVSNKKMVNNTVNNTDNKTSEFFSKLGKAAKSVGSALNLPTTAELKSQASGLFGATGENIKSKVSDLTKAFSNSSINNTSNPSTVNSKSEASSSNLATSTNTNAVSNNEILANKSTSNVSVEQGKPTVLARSETTNTTSQTENINSNSPTSISNNGSSQNTTVTAQPGQTEVSQTRQETQMQQPAQNSGGSIVDMSELTRSISRLERILISGLEVTIKDT